MSERRFSREEAEALLPEIAPLMWNAQRLKREHDEAQVKLSELRLKSQGNGHTMEGEITTLLSGIQETATEINAIIERVRAQGVEVKDLDMGLIDFPSQREGRTVYLCWKLGEEGIAWWHEMDTGYASRQPLE